MAPSKKNLCFTDLRCRILQLDLAPGADLDEASFSKHYGLSRTPLREVFQKLAGDGYLSIEPNRGAVVAVIDLPTMLRFFQTAPIVYAAIARLAAERASPPQIHGLKEAQKKIHVRARPPTKQRSRFGIISSMKSSVKWRQTLIFCQAFDGF